MILFLTFARYWFYATVSSFSRWLDVLENSLVFMQWLFFSWTENFIYVCTIKSTLFLHHSPLLLWIQRKQVCAFSFEVVTNTTKSIAFCTSAFPCFLQSYLGISAHSEDQVQALQDWTFNSLQNRCNKVADPE